MDSADRLIEYYFQRRINGMPIVDIHKSLEQQTLEEEVRDLIINQVEFRESLYLRTIKSKRLAKLCLGISIAILLSGLIVLITSILGQQIPYSTYVMLALLFLSVGFGVASVFFLQKGSKPVFSL